MWGVCLCGHMLPPASVGFREAVNEAPITGQTFEAPGTCMALPKSEQHARTRLRVLVPNKKTSIEHFSKEDIEMAKKDMERC